MKSKIVCELSMLAYAAVAVGMVLVAAWWFKPMSTEGASRPAPFARTERYRKTLGPSVEEVVEALGESRDKVESWY